MYNLPDLCYMVKMYVFSLDVDIVFLFMEWQKEIQYIFCKNLLTPMSRRIVNLASSNVQIAANTCE